MTKIDINSELMKEPNHVFWARVNRHLELTGKIEPEDANQIFPRSEIDIETLEQQLYVAAKVRRKKKKQNLWVQQHPLNQESDPDLYFYENEFPEQDLISKWDQL